MKEEELKKTLDISEKMGFDRGVKTIMLTLFEVMEKDRATIISYKTLKEIYEEYKKVNQLT